MEVSKKPSIRRNQFQRKWSTKKANIKAKPLTKAKPVSKEKKYLSIGSIQENLKPTGTHAIQGNQVSKANEYERKYKKS